MSISDNSYVMPSGNGFNILENFTKQIYGDRGSYAYNIQRYMTGPEWRGRCRCVNTIDDVPLITEDIIRQQIDKENACHAKARQMQCLVFQHQPLAEDAYYAIAAEMGLAPSACSWEETLFPHVVDLWVSSQEEGNNILQLVADNRQLIATMGNLMMDALSDRQIISYPQPGTVRVRLMMSQGYVRNFFRGENAFYGESRPTLYRKSSADPYEAKINRLIGFTRIYEFSLWISQLDCVRNWPFGDVFHGAIAQHYGLPTNGLDITSDLKVALFFACCVFDRGLNRWRPLQVDEFEHASSRPDIAALGGDSRYGMIFTAPADVSFMSKELNDPQLHLACPTPVGYQPFMRCARQSSYIIEAAEPYNLYLDETFAKYKFRLNEQLCQWIYEEMDQGQAIYPNEGFSEYTPMIDKFVRLEFYSREALSAAISFCNLDISIEEAISVLERKGHTCKGQVQWCPEAMMEEIDTKCRETIRLLGFGS